MEQFFIVGAQRSGSTYLYKILDAHPEICMARPVRPEPKYFIDEQLYLDDLSNYYELYYTHRNDEIVLGEKSTSYLESPLAAERIKKGFPSSKVLVILRNPVHRALSNYHFSKENGLETRTPMEVFMEKKEIHKAHASSVSPFDYLKRGRYIRYINLYRRHFSKEQLRIIILEELAGSLQQVQALYDSLEVSHDFVPTHYQEAVNRSRKTSIDCLHDIEGILYEEFQTYNQQLEEYLGRELSCWKKTE